LIDVLINNPHYKLSDIAKATSYSERQISRIIKQHYGISLLELRRKMKDEIIDNENINKKTEI
jgi:AraC-like DNA-binding protein